MGCSKGFHTFLLVISAFCEDVLDGELDTAGSTVGGGGSSLVIR